MGPGTEHHAQINLETTKHFAKRKKKKVKKKKLLGNNMCDLNPSWETEVQAFTHDTPQLRPVVQAEMGLVYYLVENETDPEKEILQGEVLDSKFA